MSSTKISADPIKAEDGLKLRAAAVCVRDETESEILLVSSRRLTDKWTIPGGKVESEDEDAVTAAVSCDSLPTTCLTACETRGRVCAAREAEEEAGAIGAVGRCLGIFDSSHSASRTSVYVLKVDQLLEVYSESDWRRRKWVSVDEAVKILSRHKGGEQVEYVRSLIATKMKELQSSS